MQVSEEIKALEKHNTGQMAKLGELFEELNQEIGQYNKNTNSVNQPSAWNKLTKNQFWIIIQFLDIKQVLRLRRVNRQFKHLITQCFPYYLVQIQNQVNSLEQQIVQAEQIIQQDKNSNDNPEGQAQIAQARTELGQMNKEQFMQLRMYNKAPPVILQVFSIVHKLFNTQVKNVEWSDIKSELCKPDYIGKLLALELHNLSSDQIKILSGLETVEGGAAYAGQVSQACGLVCQYLVTILTATRTKLFQDNQHLSQLVKSRNHQIRLQDILHKNTK